MADTDDLAELENLTDQILCQCLNDRFQQNKIYTYVGNILIAVNPFAWLGLYTDEVSFKYTNIHNKQDHPPHLFAIADAAFHSMTRNNKPQVCVISGESGAGKTESAKQFVRQIMDVSARGLMGGLQDGETDVADHVKVTRTRHPVESKIIQQNPILEALGNAKTAMNDNSSRFGKFIELKFNENNLVAGAEMSHYLLEKARIVMQGPGEMNFHIFGMMIAGMNDTSRDMYRLTSYEDYEYLPKESVPDPAPLMEMWRETEEAFAACGFQMDECDELYSILAAVLHFGNLDFEDGPSGDAAVLCDEKMFEMICQMLQVGVEEMKATLMTNVLELRGEVITKHLNVTKCVNARNATAKALYEKLFRWVVYKLNQSLKPEENEVDPFNSLSIGILDIFGFENFGKNGFDQMCINLANEQLHYFFNQHIFAAEMGSYKDEGLELSADVMFSDNKAIIDMFFRKPMGLLGLLDEESGFERATASSLLDKFNKNLADEPLYRVVKGNYAFEVEHYAGIIRYETDGFLEKNTDPFPGLMPKTCGESNNSIVKIFMDPTYDQPKSMANRGKSKKMFGMSKKIRQSRKQQRSSKKQRRLSKKDSMTKMSVHANKGGGRGNKKKEAQTVSSSFRASLALLMTKMGFCEPHFVRCIKPNPQKVPKAWDENLVMRQLTYTGMLQTVKMRREGYPHRIPFSEFFNAYHGIVFDFSTPVRGNAQTCTELLKALEAKIEVEREEKGLTTITTTLRDWKVAKTLVFLKYWQTDLLDGMAHIFGVSALKIQKYYRGHLARKKFMVVKQKYRDDCAAAATFLEDIGTRAMRMSNALETILEEEARKGPIGLGVQKPPEVKKEKAAKKREGEVQVNVKKFEKDLDKIKSKVVKWWIKYERNKGCHCDESGSVYPWFHGLISRSEAEDYLFDQENGAFLVRVSERVNGYALSFRFKKRIRHYKLGFSDNGGYEVVGNNEDFGTLIELIEYFQENPITPGEEDCLGEPVAAMHDLGLGINNDTDIIGKRPPKVAREARQKKAMTMTNFLDDESSGEPMADSAFLETPDEKPWYLRGNMSRKASEAELEDRGMQDGRFLVREKLRTAERIVFALSVTYKRQFYHHLLARQLQGNWFLDEKDLNNSGPLEEVIRMLQKRKSPLLATILEKDPYAAPIEGGMSPPPAASPPKSPNNYRTMGTMSPGGLVPSTYSTVDDVVAWLAGLGMSRYAGAFYKAKFDGKKLHKANEKQLRKLLKNEDDYRLVVRALR